MRKYNNLQKRVIKEFLNNKVVYLLLAFILTVSFFVRIYRTDQLLGFYFDQGRDAIVIWDFLKNGELFLIGPTTGIEGIFRGPWYYWLITPFYFLGGGNPVWPAVFLASTTVVASGLAFYLGKKIHSYQAGLLAAAISGFSFFLMIASRWLSNTTPMFLISMLLVWSLILVAEGKRWAWIAVGFLLGLSMQFGSAAETFYFPAVAIFALLYRKHGPTLKVAVISLLALIITFVPQIVFDAIHDGILREAISKFLLKEENFQASFWETLQLRVPFYYDVFFSKLDPVSTASRQLLFLLSVLALVFSIKELIKNIGVQILSLLLLSPLVGMLFFQGNFGNIYDYYFTGFYLIFVLLLSVILAEYAKQKIGIVIVALFLLIFLRDNIPITKSYITSGVDGPEHISLGNQLQSLDWIFEDSKTDFNVDVYVPPVIPHAYNYLVLWKASEKCGKSLCGLKLDANVPLLYTLYEVDPPHPERLEAWLARQKGIGTVEDEKKFGGITVEQRTRI